MTRQTYWLGGLSVLALGLVALAGAPFADTDSAVPDNEAAMIRGGVYKAWSGYVLVVSRPSWGRRLLLALIGLGATMSVFAAAVWKRTSRSVVSPPHGSSAMRIRVTLRGRTGAFIAPVVVTALLSWPRPGGLARAEAPGDPPPPSLDQIAAAIRGQWDRVQSLRVVYDEGWTALQPPAVVMKYHETTALIEQKATSAFKGKKRHYRQFAGGKSRPLNPGLRNTDGLPLEIGFNGEQVTQKQGTFSALVLGPGTEPSVWRNFDQSYLENLDRPLDNPSDPPGAHLRDRLPDAFTSPGFEVRPGTEPVDGAPCVVVTRPGAETIWLDPAVNYGVRKHELFDPQSKALRVRRVNRDFAEVAPGVWLPRLCYREEGAQKPAPESERGKPMVRYTFKVVELEVNDVPDALFELEIPTGVMVADATRLPPKDNKPQYLDYEMPADRSVLDQVVQAAIVKKAERVASRRSGLVLMVANVAILVAVYIGHRVWRHRRGPAA